MAHLVKNQPAMWEIWVQFLDWEDPLEKGTATHSSGEGNSYPFQYPGLENSMDYIVRGVAKSQK